MEVQKQGPIVLDTATLLRAFTELMSATSPNWRASRGPNAALQHMFLKWHKQHAHAVSGLHGLQSMASSNPAALNKFLTDHGFPATFGPSKQDDVGVVAILDILVQWAVEATAGNIITYSHAVGAGSYPAFTVPKRAGGVQGVEFYNSPMTPPANHPLVRILTKDNSSVWLMMSDRPATGQDLANMSLHAMDNLMPMDDTWYSGVTVPCLEINTQGQVDWLLGLTDSMMVVAQAFQFFKLRMNIEGAWVKTTTGVRAKRRGARSGPVIFNRPFVGWFTREGSSFPFGAFYADETCWRDAGALKDL